MSFFQRPNKQHSPPNQSPTQRMGFTIETWVRQQLEAKGLRLITQNFVSKFGEIDLIMREKNDLTFIEVRYRKSDEYGDPLETITKAKQRRIIKTAEFFLRRDPQWEALMPRFDAVAVTGIFPNLKMNWILDAFLVE